MAIVSVHEAQKTLMPDRVAEGFSVVVCTYKRSASLKRFLGSLAEQDCRATELIIVDASPDDSTEHLIKSYESTETLADSVKYFRVSGSLRGLTRQRNFALDRVITPLVAFFDDDIVLLPGCLRQMMQAHASSSGVVGVGACIDNSVRNPDLLWKVRRLLRIVTHLRPGSYHRSGFSVPWGFLQRTDQIVEADCLPGGATMWKTDIARAVRFDEHFEGYAQGEDLKFSLEILKFGRLVIAGNSRVLHLHDAKGRPNHFELGYMEIYNRYEIHRKCLQNRSWRDVVVFFYAWTIDSVLLARFLLFPKSVLPIVKQLLGRVSAGFDLITHHHSRFS